MKDINLSSRRYYFISLYLSLFFFLIRSQHDLDDLFATIDYYESFSTPKECFNIYHDYPIGPRFLIIKIQYQLISREPEIYINNVIKYYQLKRIDRPCKSSFTIPNLNFYKKIAFSIDLFLYYIKKPMSWSFYYFEKGFDQVPLIIVTTTNSFVVYVEFLDIVDEKSIEYYEYMPEVTSYLLEIQKNIGPICVVTEYMPRIVLWPKEIFLRNSDLITGVNIEYIHNEKLILTENYPAFECYTNKIFPNSTVYLVYEGHKSNMLLKLIYSYLDFKRPISQISYVLFLNLKIINIEIMKTLPIHSIKIFLIKADPKITRLNNVTFHELISKSNIIYYRSSQRLIEISQGVKKYKKCSQFL